MILSSGFFLIAMPGDDEARRCGCCSCRVDGFGFKAPIEPKLLPLLLPARSEFEANAGSLVLAAWLGGDTGDSGGYIKLKNSQAFKLMQISFNKIKPGSS